MSLVPGILLLVFSSASPSQLTLEPTLTPTGVLTEIRMEGEVVATRLGVMIVKPGWNGQWASQFDARAPVLEVAQDGPNTLWRGQLPTEAGPVEFQERLRPTEGALRVEYSLTPSTELACQSVYLTVSVPVADTAGVGKWYSHTGTDLRVETFPAELPDPYHIYSGFTEWFAWVLPSGKGIRFEVGEAGFHEVSLQDDRQFKMDTFELQLPVPGTRVLKAGETVEFGLLMRPFSAMQAAKEVTAAMAEAKAQRVEFTSREALRLGPIGQATLVGEVGPPRPLAQFDALEWTLNLAATYDNPFDPDDIQVEATFSCPSGKRMTVGGFFYVPYDRIIVHDQERLRKTGDPVWKVRFTPPEPGPYRLTVKATDRSGTVTAEAVSFEVIPSERPGFVRRAKRTPHYLEFDSGEPYFAIGENMSWGGVRQTLDYDMWLPALGESGGNFARIWLVRWNMGLEWSPQDPGHRGEFYGLGRYSPDNAWRLDYVLNLAAQNGIYCMLALGYHGELMDREAYFGEQCWVYNPYNAANGGPCQKPDEFWTNEEARRLYKQRLWYYVARYAYNTHIQSWEFWNEVVAPADWVAEMAAYLREIDPYDHLITTTYGYPEVWSIPEIDFTQTHTYGTDDKRHDSAADIARLCRAHTQQFDKPHLVGEFGIDWKTSDTNHDPEGHGVNLHNGLWAAMGSRSLGGAMIWYWDGYVHALDLYREFHALRRFVNDVPWNKLKFRLAQTTPPTVATEPDTPWGVVTVKPPLEWARATGTDFVVQPYGRVEGPGEFSSFLFSPSKPDLRQPLRFRVTCPGGGQLVMHVGRVSARARLQVNIDGQQAWEKEFVAGPAGEGEYKATEWLEQYGIWQSTFDQEYAIDLPPGEHTLSLDNVEGDWLEVREYRFIGCLDPQYAGTLDVYGIQTQDYAILWLHNRVHNWYNRSHGNPIEPVTGASFELLGLRDGSYTITWYDTYTGLRTCEEEARCGESRLRIVVPEVKQDVACKIRLKNTEAREGQSRVEDR
ncbi:MAG: DUF5060 domain-containing protein [Candidatus Zipacnadales bacterium]